MSLAFVNRVNSMYKHQRSVEERNPAPPEPSPVAALRDRHRAERERLEERIQAKQKKLLEQHAAERMRDHRYSNTGQQPQHMLDEHSRQQQALSSKAASDRRDMKARHADEIERALAKHGTAP